MTCMSAGSSSGHVWTTQSADQQMCTAHFSFLQCISIHLFLFCFCHYCYVFPHNYIRLVILRGNLWSNGPLSKSVTGQPMPCTQTLSLRTCHARTRAHNTLHPIHQPVWKQLWKWLWVGEQCQHCCHDLTMI